MAVQQVAVGKAAPKRRDSSLWSDAWGRLMKNRAAVMGLVIILALIFMAIFADIIAPYSYEKQTLTDQSRVPGWVVSIFPTMQGYAKISDKYVLGADDLGRDLLSRIIYGARVSLAVAFVGPLVALIIGLPYGIVSGYYGGKVDNLMMRFVDIMTAFPDLLFIILLMAFFRSGFATENPESFVGRLSALDAQFGGMLFIFIGIGLTSWTGLARLARGQILSIKQREFIEAARVIGNNDQRIMAQHILPNILGPIVVSITLAIPGFISAEAFLSFIGLGVNRPTPSWGAMISDGSRAIRTYPNQAIFPAMALAIIMFAFNFLGDGLRDALDPRMRGTS